MFFRCVSGAATRLNIDKKEMDDMDDVMFGFLSEDEQQLQMLDRRWIHSSEPAGGRLVDPGPGSRR